MAEDDMLVNFKLDNEALEAKPSFKGGRWKDRLSARRAALPNRKRPSKSGDSAQDNSETRTPGTQSRSLQGQEQNRHTTKRARIDPSARSLKSKSQGGPRQVVSSLFTFNPTPKITFEEPAQSSEPAKPSNAPLESELNNFTSLGLSQSLAEHLLHKMQINAPTAVQKSSVPQLVSNDTDAFIQAETGSGKTLAYLLPIVQRIMHLSKPIPAAQPAASEAPILRTSGLFAIILAPTRELSKQISVVLENLLRCAHWVVSGTVIGGEKKKSEKARLRKGLNILIATPGRLADHLDNTEVLDVSNVRWLVLDEGDRLMELGFEQDIQKILAKLRTRFLNNSRIAGLPPRRNTILCSATMKMNVQKLGEMSLKEALHIRATQQSLGTEVAAESTEQEFSAPAQLNQSFAIVPAKLRLVSLVGLLKRSFLRRGSVMKTIVFISCADSVDFHFEVLSRSHSHDTPKTEEEKSSETSKTSTNQSFRTSAFARAFAPKDNLVQLFKLHGSLPQAVRTSTLMAFSRCKDPAVLICTDVASRGLDLPNVDFVIEYDPPFNKDDHLHRIGRTARAGKDGRATIFLMPGSEEGYVQILKESRANGGRDIVHHDSTELLKKGFATTGLGGDKNWEHRATEWQLNIERWALKSPTHLEQARRAYQSHIRAYATHVASERQMFDMTSLHLGHLAKAFALRDKPGSIRVPGLRPSKDSMNTDKAERRAQAKTSGGIKRTVLSDDHEISEQTADLREAAKMMKARTSSQLQGASEFNLG